MPSAHDHSLVGKLNLLRNIIDLFTKCLGRLRRNRRIKTGNVPVKINLGCGLSVARGWYNVDGSINSFIASWPQIIHRVLYHISGANRYYSLSEYCAILNENIFIHHDLSYGLPFSDGVADHIYSSHFLEHLYRHEARHILFEAFRVLKPGGIIRICIPDLSHAFTLYVNGEKTAMLDKYFFVEDKGSSFARHKYMYDFELLQTALEEAGFQNIKRCSFGNGCTPDIEVLDNRPEDTLFVEAERPRLNR